MTSHTKLFQDEFLETSQSLVAIFAFTLKSYNIWGHSHVTLTFGLPGTSVKFTGDTAFQTEAPS